MWLGPLILAAAVFWLALGAATIRHDMGGPIDDRKEDMRDMDGVRIAGDCYSACTLYLGLPETCVTPDARLGFHSPFLRVAGLDVPMPRDQWEAVTQDMASHYPPAIAEWFLRNARYHTEPVILTGRQAIEMGARPC